MLKVKVKNKGCKWIVLIKVYIHVKFERVMVNSFTTVMDLNINLYLTLKTEIYVNSKVKAKDKGHNE